MNREKPYFLKRIAAYLIDLIIVTLLASAISMVFFKNEEYNMYSEQLMTLTKKYTNNEISKDDYAKEFNDLNYFMTKESVDVTIVNCSVAVVYFVVLCYFCHGITLGKYLMKLQIVSANDKELNMGHYLIRALFVNLILSNLVSISFVLLMNKDTFINVYPKVSTALTLFLLASILFVMYRNDGRGLHDLMANTKIISTKKDKNTVEVPEKKEEIQEAKVIEEKKTDTKKKTTKKSTKKTGGKK